MTPFWHISIRYQTRNKQFTFSSSSSTFCKTEISQWNWRKFGTLVLLIKDHFSVGHLLRNLYDYRLQKQLRREKITFQNQYCDRKEGGTEQRERNGSLAWYWGFLNSSSLGERSYSASSTKHLVHRKSGNKRHTFFDIGNLDMPLNIVER